jgi:hypothetical protein
MLNGKMQNNIDKNIVHLNLPQLKAYVVNAKITIGLCSRGFGKTRGLHGPKINRCIYSLAKGTGLFVGESEYKILSVFLPEIKRFFDSVGLINNQHYFVCKRPPAKFTKEYKYQLPYSEVEDWSKFISFYTGFGLHLASMSFNAESKNGFSTDMMIIDEIKKIRGDKVDQLMPTLRGNRDLFAHQPDHYSVLMTTDKFIEDGDDTWFYKYRDIKTDDLAESVILLQHERDMALQHYLSKNLINIEYADDNIIARHVEVFNNSKYALAIDRNLLKMRSRCVHFIEGSVIDNIDSFDLDSLKTEYQKLGKRSFSIIYLNEDDMITQGAFYHMLEEKIHTYEAIATDDMRGFAEDDKFNILEELDSRYDTDCISTMPLEISLDYGGRFNCIVVAQAYSNTFWLLKDFWVKQGENHVTCAKNLVHHYRHHKRKHVILWGDPMGDKDDRGDGHTRISEVIDILIKAGWTVDNMAQHYNYIPLNRRHRIYEMILDESIDRNPNYPKLRINAYRCKDTFNSMALAKVKKSTTQEFEKDKSKERDIKYPQERATHLSDAVDYYVCTKFLDAFPLVD